MWSSHTIGPSLFSPSDQPFLLPWETTEWADQRSQRCRSGVSLGRTSLSGAAQSTGPRIGSPSVLAWRLRPCLALSAGLQCRRSLPWTVLHVRSRPGPQTSFRSLLRIRQSRQFEFQPGSTGCRSATEFLWWTRSSDSAITSERKDRRSHILGGQRREPEGSRSASPSCDAHLLTRLAAILLQIDAFQLGDFLVVHGAGFPEPRDLDSATRLAGVRRKPDQRGLRVVQSCRTHIRLLLRLHVGCCRFLPLRVGSFSRVAIGQRRRGVGLEETC